MSTIKLCAIALVCFGALVIDQPTINTLVLGLIAMMSAITAYFNRKHSHKLEAIAKVADNTHTLVNSQMGVQLQLHAVTTRELANATGKPEHIEAAKDAQRNLEEYRTKQKIMDRTPAMPASES